MKKSEFLRFLILRTIGNFLLLFAIFGILATFGPALYYELSIKIANARGIKYVVATTNITPTILPTPVPGQIQPSVTPLPSPTPTPPRAIGIDNFANVLAGPTEQILTPVDTNFSIIIPKIGASAKIYPNVDPANSDEFLPILQKGVAHAKGTVFPGMKGNIYLFAHSTDNFWDVGRYNAVFYLLKELTNGDEIAIFFKGKRHNYIVTDSKIVDPSNVSYIINSQHQKTEQLIMQTCWPPGTTFQRLLVFAKPK